MAKSISAKKIGISVGIYIRQGMYFWKFNEAKNILCFEVSV
ncbi:hypothetical protein AM1_G0124 (plasmid) [Acaryochloris marina MBIC11017]|uniref:Uncharacterized protein n=1 Tax=Acaryochloris marina (strain MBIC 11017) TaxID=329726 RepID=A8ZQL8_ACAM1|nr:hypothetical protein AM1_G0124 [Acaryochloris marina MBIC11017]